MNLLNTQYYAEFALLEMGATPMSDLAIAMSLLQLLSQMLTVNTTIVLSRIHFSRVKITIANAIAITHCE